MPKPDPIKEYIAQEIQRAGMMLGSRRTVDHQAAADEGSFEVIKTITDSMAQKVSPLETLIRVRTENSSRYFKVKVSEML